MINYQNGKKLALVGFGGGCILYCLILLLTSLFRTDLPFLGLVYMLLYLIAALGFFVMFLSKGKMLDLVTCGAVVMVVVSLWLSGSLGVSGVLDAIYDLERGIVDAKSLLIGIVASILGSVLYAVLALRVKKHRPLLALLLILAFLYDVIGGSGLLIIAGELGLGLSFFSYLNNLIYIVIYALPVLAIKSEK